MKAYKILALLAIALSFASCEDFLDKQPEENLTLDDIFSNRIYTRDFLSHIYTWIPTEANFADDGGAWRSPYTGGCDEMEITFGGAYSHQINNGGWNPTDIKRTQVWQESYMAIRKCNMMIERVDECDATEDEKRRWKGESYFLRAYFHFLAFRAYGPIILADHVYSTNENIHQYRRATADDVVKMICDDCDEAIKLLHDRATWETTDTGRATTIAAYALKSRALLYLASPLYNGNTMFADLKDPIDKRNLINQVYSEEKWKDAMDASLKAITEAETAGHKLFNEYPNDPVKNYQYLFLSDTYNTETLWAKNIGTYQHHFNCGDPAACNGFSILCPTQEMVDAYQMADGSDPIIGYTDGIHINSDGKKIPIKVPIINPKSGYVDEGFVVEGYPGRWEAGVSNMYVNREPRFYASINFAGALWKTTKNSGWTKPHYCEFWYSGMDGRGVVTGSDYCKTGYNMKKLMHPDSKHNEYFPRTIWAFIRLGEIYLNAAEAINEYAGPTADCYKYINAIRTRAGLPELEAGLSKEEMRKKIQHERRIELAFENHRFFDVRRWMIAEETQGVPIHSMNIYEGTSLQDPAFYKRIKCEDRVFESPKHYFFPVEQDEIDKHEKKELVQNLGWTTLAEE